MPHITAQLNNLRQSPRKVRLVADLVRGKKVTDAVLTLQFAPKRAALPIHKLIVSAIANGKAQSIDTDNLVVKKIEVNVGKTLMRRRPVAHGSAHPIHKRTSAIFVELSTKIVNSHKAIGNSEVKAKIKPELKKETKAKIKRSIPKLVPTA